MIHPLSLRRWASLDVLLASYYGVFVLAACFGSGPNHALAMKGMSANLVVFVATVAFHRSDVAERFSLFKSALYRTVLFAAFLTSYLQLQIVLPSVTSRILDAQVYAVDLALFGFEPALAWDRFVTPARVEWFAFFYYLHFFVLSSHVVPLMLFGGRGKLLASFTLGILIVFCTGHLTYLLAHGADGGCGRGRGQRHFSIAPHRGAELRGDVRVRPPAHAALLLDMARARVHRGEYHRRDALSALALHRGRDRRPGVGGGGDGGDRAYFQQRSSLACEGGPSSRVR